MKLLCKTKEKLKHQLQNTLRRPPPHQANKKTARGLWCVFSRLPKSPPTMLYFLPCRFLFVKFCIAFLNKIKLNRDKIFHCIKFRITYSTDVCDLQNRRKSSVLLPVLYNSFCNRMTYAGNFC